MTQKCIAGTCDCCPEKPTSKRSRKPTQPVVQPVKTRKPRGQIRKPLANEPKLRIEIGRVPHDVRVYVGDEQIGLVTSLEVKATLMGDTHVLIEFGPNLSERMQAEVKRYRRMLKPFAPFVSVR